MEAVVTNRSLPYLYRKIESLPFKMQEEVSLFTDFLHNRNKLKSDIYFDADDNRFSELSLASLSEEWNSSEDDEWDTLLSQMPSIP